MIGAVQVRLAKPLDGPAGAITIVTVTLPDDAQLARYAFIDDPEVRGLAASTDLPLPALHLLEYADAACIADAQAGLLSSARRWEREAAGIYLSRHERRRTVRLRRPIGGKRILHVETGASSVTDATGLSAMQVATLAHDDREAIHSAMCCAGGEEPLTSWELSR